MGAPRFDWQDIPLAHAMDTNHVVFDIDGKSFDGAAVNVGNPHCVLFVDNAEGRAGRGARPEDRKARDFSPRASTPSL
ncbi:MAG: hypothetical protein WDM89_16180 [Rhizomicrobium sp.]